MNEKLIALAIPFFFALIGLELWLDVRRARRARAGGAAPDRWYRYHDAITNLSCGVGQQLLAPFAKLVVIGGYVLVYERLAPVHLSHASAATWALGLLGVDFCYYWFHRASHRVNVIWAAHVVHHQSEEYNLSVALRQSALQPLLGAPFYWPLALLGVPPAVLLLSVTLNTLYQFWIHVRGVGRLPRALEWVLNTPSHHRVHHGINPAYIDKNYGGVLIVWDRLFGTFAPEREEPAYGTVQPLASFNPLWANAQYWVAIARMSRAAGSLREAAWAWLAPPEWKPRALGGVATVPEASRATQRRYDVRAARAVDVYAGVGFALVSVATTAFLAMSAQVRVAHGVAAALIAAALIGWGALFEGRRWGRAFELARLAATVGAVAWLGREALDGSGYWAAVVGTAVLAAGAGAWVIALPPYAPSLAPPIGGEGALGVATAGAPLGSAGHDVGTHSRE